MQSNLARTIFIALLAAGLFGLFLLVTPKLTAGGSGVGATATTVPPSTAVTTTTLAVTTTVPVPVTTTLPVSVTTLPIPTTTLPVGWDPATQNEASGYDGSVLMAASTVGPEGVVIGAGDTVVWDVVVTNATDDDLWGVFAYVEGFGPGACERRHIGPGESTRCRATGIAYVGTTDVVAWVNAWTEVRQVKDIALVPLTVAP